jgi:hypothetical protein
MKPAIHDITIRRGATFGPKRFAFKDDAGNPVDLIGWKVWAHARKRPLGPLLFDLAPQITDAPAGVVTIYRTDEQTSAYPRLEEGAWDLLLENPDGERIGPLVAGFVNVQIPSTQPPYAAS